MVLSVLGHLGAKLGHSDHFPFLGLAWYHRAVVTVFGKEFRSMLKHCVDLHFSVYSDLPPQGIYFEALVERAFKQVKIPFAPVTPGGRNQPRHDLEVEEGRISIKSETGESTRPASINITKLCTTEREPWDADTLKERVLEHLARYDTILMFRAIWEPEVFRLQLVEIPVDLLKLIGDCDPAPVGTRKGQRSLGADVYRKKGDGGTLVFHVHFDASDKKCSVRNIRLQDCDVLLEWKKKRGD